MARKRSTRIQYNKLVPQDSFLGDYLVYMSKLETAYAYDFWTGAWLISGAVGREIVVNRPGAPVYLNLYIILVAESGITRKSTSVRFATNFIRRLCTESQVLIEGKTTPEYLTQCLWMNSERFGKGSACISVSELATFLGREKYVEQLPSLLTDLYDCPEFRSGGGSLSSGTKTIKNVFVSFLSASTPSWLLRAVNPDVIEGGFTSRVCFIVAEEPKQRQSWPETLDDGIKERLERHLDRIRDRSREVGRIDISDGGRKAFDRWYRSRVLYRDVFRSSFQSREDSHCLRLAAFLCINDDTWVIQQTHILAAIKIITQVREDGASIFEGTGSNSRFIIGIDKIRDKLLVAGINGLPQTQLTKAVANVMTAEHLRAVLDIMHELGMVQQFQNVQVGRGRPVTIWRATSALVASNAITDVVEAFAPTRS